MGKSDKTSPTIGVRFRQIAVSDDIRKRNIQKEEHAISSIGEQLRNVSPNLE